MSNNLVSMNNLLDILSPVKTNISNKINDKDINEEQKEKLNKTNIIDTTTNSSGFLSDNGKYNNINIDNINESIDKTNNVYDIFKIKEEIQQNENKSKMPIQVILFSSQLYNNIIYTIGGWNGSNSISNVFAYNIETDTWSTKMSCPFEISYTDSILYNNNIYMTGGRTSSGESKYINIYDIETDTWSRAKDLISARFGHISEVSDSKIYTITGYYKIKTVEIYDINTDTISLGSNIPTPRAQLSSCIYNDKIYTFGGESHYVLEIYDIKTDTWISGPNYELNDHFMDSFIYNDNIYCVGGNSFNSKSVIKFDIKNNKWSKVCDINYKRFGCRCINIKNKVYIIGSYSLIPTELLTLPYMDYDISLPSSIQNKLDCISSIGAGTKILSDKGEYIDIPKGYRFMESNEVIDFIKILDQI